jgi:vitamin B12 transporter
MLEKYRKLYPAVFLLCFSTSVIADDDIVSFAPMTIYGVEADATRLQNELNRADLESTEMPDLNSVLKRQTAVMLNQGSGQMMTGISLRGAGGSGQGMFTLDGVPLFGNFAGMYSLSHYPLDAFDKITVSHGTGDEHHGSRTLGGAIHLQTRKLHDKETFLHLEGGSYETVRGAVGGGLETKAGDFSAVVGRSDIFNGISQAQNGSEPDNFGLTHASGNWFKKLGDGSLDASLYFVKSNEDTDGVGFILPSRKIRWVDDHLGKLTDETWVAQLHGQYDVTSNWNSALQLGFTQDAQKGKTNLIKPYSITSQLYLLDWKNTHHLPLDDDSRNQASLIWGVNTQYQQVVNISANQTVISPNVRGKLVLGDWQLNADGRFDFDDVYGGHSVFSLGVNRSLPKNVNIFANGGTGYRQPGVSELMNPVFGNKALQGESNAGGEIGLRWEPLPESEIKISGYYQNYQQMITLQQNSTTGISRAENVPEATVFGAELQSQYRWLNIWESGLNYSYMDATNSTTHLKIAVRPEHQSTFWNEIQLLKPLKFRVELNVRSGYWFDAANTLWAESAPRLNAMLKYQVTPKTEVYVRGENITDNRTPELYDFNYNGAAVYAGFRTNF